MRWIYGFRQVGRRTLTESEIEALKRSAARYFNLRFAYGGLSTLLALLGLLEVIVAAGGFHWAWAAFAILIVASLVALAHASSIEGTAYLYRRTARVGQVDIFEHAEPLREVRERYQTLVDEDGDCVRGLFWQEDEKILVWMEKMAGKAATTFETPIDDDVIVSIEGIPVRRGRNAVSVSLS